jgi:hypothetical protein
VADRSEDVLSAKVALLATAAVLGVVASVWNLVDRRGHRFDLRLAATAVALGLLFLAGFATVRRLDDLRAEAYNPSSAAAIDVTLRRINWWDDFLAWCLRDVLLGATLVAGIGARRRLWWAQVALLVLTVFWGFMIWAAIIGGVRW